MRDRDLLNKGQPARHSMRKALTTDQIGVRGGQSATIISFIGDTAKRARHKHKNGAGDIAA